MDIKCILCGREVVAPDNLVAGQHVKCPECGGKFSYAPVRTTISEQDLRAAIAECRRDPELDHYYTEAPEGARLYIAMFFYGQVFKSRMDVDAYVKAFAELGTELQEADLRYLLQYEEDELMRKYLQDRLRALGVQVDEPGVNAKTAKRPRIGIIRNNPNHRPAAEPVEIVGEPTEVRPVAPATMSVRKRLPWQQLVMLGAVVTAIVLVLIVIVKSARTSRRQSMPASSAVAERQSEAMRNSADSAAQKSASNRDEVDKKQLKDDFNAYLDRERKLLEGIVSESTLAYDEIVGDQLRLSRILADIDAENSRRELRAATNGWIRFEKPEVVMMILKDKDLNALAMKYIGEDFSAICNECRSRIKSEMQFHIEHERLLTENRKKYHQKIAGVDEEVEKKSAEARKLRNEANKMLAKRLAGQKNKLSNLEATLARIRSSGTVNKNTMNECQVLESEISDTRDEISKMEELVASGRASSAHITATEAENIARRKMDSALSSRQDEDNAVQVRMDNIRSLFLLSVTFEERSLDRVRSSMQSRKDALSVRMSDAKSRLEVIHKASTNLDMLSPRQLEDIKRRIGAKIGDSVVEGLNGKDAR